MRIIAQGLIRSLLTLLLLLAVTGEAAVRRGDCGGRHLKFNIGVYDPVGASESSRFGPTREPIEDDRYVASYLLAPWEHRSIRPPTTWVGCIPHVDTFFRHATDKSTADVIFCIVLYLIRRCSILDAEKN